MTTPVIPEGFWPQIQHQLDRVAEEKPDTFDAVRAILVDPAYTDIAAYVHRNGQRPFSADEAFFAGSGGDEDLADALLEAGWVVVASEASYYYAARHRRTGEELTYIEGDVVRGNRFARH